MPLDRDDISYLAETDFRGAHKLFGIRQTDRLHHTYVIGKTGAGKSTLLELLLWQDLAAGRGFALVDPHGDLAERIWRKCPDSLRDRLTYVNVPDPTSPYGYNPLRRVREDRIPLAASGVLEALRKLWPTAWGVRMEHILRNSLYALLEREGSSLNDILRLFDDKRYRSSVVAGIRNPVVKAYWKTEFEKYPARMRADAVAPVQNKLGALLADPTLRRVLVQPTADIHFRSLMDESRGLLVNLSRGQLGEDASQVLGGLIVTTIGLAGFSRADAPASDRAPFFLYVDEFQSFTTLAFVSMMSELRKFGVGLTLAHQYLNQLEPDVRHAVLGNAGTLVTFRLGAEDAPLIAAEMQPKIGTGDLIRLANHSIYLKLMIDGTPSNPFSARTIALE